MSMMGLFVVLFSIRALLVWRFLHDGTAVVLSPQKKNPEALAFVKFENIEPLALPSLFFCSAGRERCGQARPYLLFPEHGIAPRRLDHAQVSLASSQCSSILWRRASIFCRISCSRRFARQKRLRRRRVRADWDSFLEVVVITCWCRHPRPPLLSELQDRNALACTASACRRPSSRLSRATRSTLAGPTSDDELGFPFAPSYLTLPHRFESYFRSVRATWGACIPTRRRGTARWWPARWGI